MATNDTLPQQIRDGDDWFLGFMSRLDPGNLPEKMLQASQNMRLQRGTATIRYGAKRLNGFYSNTNIGNLNAVINYTDPRTGTEYILMVLSDRILLCFEDGQTYKEIPYVYSANSLSNHAYPTLLLGEEVQAIQALNKVYILRGSAKTTAANVTFTNANIHVNQWGTFTVNNFPFRRWNSIPYSYNLVTGELTLTIQNNNGFNVGDRLQFVSPFNNDVISAITNTTTVVKWTATAPYPATGTISFMLWSDVYYTEFIVQSTSEPHFNGTYATIIPSDIINSGTLQFYVFNSTGQQINSNTNRNGMTVLQAKSPIVWDGVSNTASPVNQTAVMTSTAAKVPPADFGIYFQNRLVLKTNRHYIAVSDILEDTFDMQLNNFNINLGSGDDIVGFLPWIENQFLVFMGRAIYVAFVETTSYIQGTAPGVNSSITVITNEVGCLSRRSIVNAGQFVFFLSPKGVHMLTPQLDLKLLGNTQPLSEPIADFFDAINYSTANHSAAAYYNNRFYISIPWNGSKFNNRVAVYNTLNQQWESIDLFPDNMHVDELFVSSYGNERRLMAGCRIWSGWYNTSGVTTPVLSAGVALFDEVQNFDQWNYSTASPGQLVSTPIAGLIRTREYMFDSLSEKRFTRAQVQTSNIAGDRIQITASAYDPDASEMILDYTFESGTHTTLRPRVALRGSAIDIEVKILSGSPSIKTVSVTGITTDRQMISQE